MTRSVQERNELPGKMLRILFIHRPLEAALPQSRLYNLPPKASLRDDPTLRHFHLVYAAKGEEELHQILRRIVGKLTNNSADCVGYCGVKNDGAHLHACKIHAHLLTWLKHPLILILRYKV